MSIDVNAGRSMLQPTLDTCRYVVVRSQSWTLRFSGLRDARFSSPSNKWMELTAPVLFGPLNEWREHYPQWNEQGVWARRQMGDCYALVADSVLTQSQPFPRDEQYHMDKIRLELRFRVIKSTTAPEYIIHDYLVHSTTTVAKSLLEKPHFNIGRWYAQQ